MSNAKNITRVSSKIIGLLFLSSVIHIFFPTAATAAGTCGFSNTLCMWEQTEFGGAQLNVAPLPPHNGACIDLVEHGWGKRVKSAINTNSRTASLFASDDCTGRPFPIDGNSRVGSISFEANSVYVLN